MKIHRRSVALAAAAILMAADQVVVTTEDALTNGVTAGEKPGAR